MRSEVQGVEAWWGKVGEYFAEEFGGEGEEVVGLVGRVHFEMGMGRLVVRLEARRSSVAAPGELMGCFLLDKYLGICRDGD